LARGGTPEQAKAFSENFCKACLSRMSASDKVRVQQVFSCLYSDKVRVQQVTPSCT
jgi:hypothetical protein